MKKYGLTKNKKYYYKIRGYMRNLKQAIRITDIDGNVTDYESVNDAMEATGYSRVGIWHALNKGKLGTGKYKGYKIEKI